MELWKKQLFKKKKLKKKGNKLGKYVKRGRQCHIDLILGSHFHLIPHADLKSSISHKADRTFPPFEAQYQHIME